MKNFLGKILVFVLIVAGITAGINEVFILRQNQIPDTMSDMRNNNSQIKNVPDGITLCNFGSSHGLYSFNYANFTDKYVCYNFGQTSQRLSYDYRILYNYIDKFADGAIIIIPISHFSFFGPLETSYDNFASLNKRYYKFLPSELIKEYDKKTDFFVNYVPALAADDSISLVKTLMGKGEESAWDSTTSKEFAETNAYNRYQTFVKSKLDENGKRWYNSEEIDALYKMIELCKMNNLVPVMVSTPLLTEYSKAVKENDPSFLNDFYGVIDTVVEKTGVTYLDYSFDTRFTNDYSLFFDVDHLNRVGALLFTEIIVEELQNT